MGRPAMNAKQHNTIVLKTGARSRNFIAVRCRPQNTDKQQSYHDIKRVTYKTSRSLPTKLATSKMHRKGDVLKSAACCLQFPSRRRPAEGVDLIRAGGRSLEDIGRSPVDQMCPASPTGACT